jgi:hypothetical protein
MKVVSSAIKRLAKYISAQFFFHPAALLRVGLLALQLGMDQTLFTFIQMAIRFGRCNHGFEQGLAVGFGGR